MWRDVTPGNEFCQMKAWRDLVKIYLADNFLLQLERSRYGAENGSLGFTQMITKDNALFKSCAK